jgi:ribosome biogenesis protein SSF1/2
MASAQFKFKVSEDLFGCLKRVVLLSFDKDTERISFRHYGISAAPSGVTKSVKNLVNRRQLPNMGALGDVSELLTKSGCGSVWRCLPPP